jgi:diadenosine tetraphosphatase ApaH/serine/threonine PP2A family protein phosphatase
MHGDLLRRTVGEAVGTALLLAAVVGSGIMGDRLSGGNVAIALLANNTKRVAGVLFVNAGSVGKPKDGDPRACYVVMDTGGEVAVEFHRIPYDIESAATAIRESSLPDKFASDIETGGATAPTPAVST